MTTFFVRPDASHNTVRNGLSYETAWGGWGEVSWGTVAGANQLYVCGAHFYETTVTVNGAGADANNRLSIRGDYLGDPGVLNLTLSAVLNLNQNNLYIPNLDINSTNGSAIYISPGKSNVQIEGCSLLTTNAHGIYLAAGVDTALTNCEILNCNIAASKHGIAWWPNADKATSLSELTISGNTINAGTTGIFLFDESIGVVSASDVLIHNNIIRATKDCGLRFSMSQEDVTKGNRLTITDNDIQYCGQGGANAAGGVLLVGFTDVLVTGNNLSNNFGVYGGINPQYCKNLVVTDNVCNNNFSDDIDGNGILIDNGCDNVTVTRNICSGNDRIPVSTYKPLNPYGGSGIMVLNAHNVRVYGNYGDSNRVGFHITFSVDPTNVQIFNNTFTNCRVGGLDSAGSSGTANPLEYTVKNNILTGGPNAVFALQTYAAKQINADYNCLYGFLGNSAQPAGSHDSHTDPVLSGFIPAADSPCVAGGERIDPTWTDFYGHRFAGKPTLGAVERKRTAHLRR